MRRIKVGFESKVLGLASLCNEYIEKFNKETSGSIDKCLANRDKIVDIVNQVDNLLTMLIQTLFEKNNKISNIYDIRDTLIEHRNNITHISMNNYKHFILEESEDYNIEDLKFYSTFKRHRNLE